MSEDEQHALALARLIVHRAPWVLIDEVLDALDDAALERAIDVFAKDLKESAIIHIGRTDAHEYFSRVLHLIKDPERKLAPAAPLLATST